MGKSDLERQISDSHYGVSEEFERSSKKFMRALVPDRPSLRIIDVGCGTGLNSGFLAAKGHSVTGIDLSPVAIQKYCERGLKGIVCDLEAGKAPFADGSFDLAYVSEIIEHCADTAPFLGELYRLLAPGGKVLLSTPNSAFWPFRILGLIGQTPSEYQHPGHVRFFSIRNLSAAIRGAGFEIERVAARHMYAVIGPRIGDAVTPLIEAIGFSKEPRFATGDHFWQLSRFSSMASGFWADTLIVVARKPEIGVSERSA
jgi:SAM-dependent methyltransferase